MVRDISPPLPRERVRPPDRPLTPTTGSTTFERARRQTPAVADTEP